MTRQQIKDETLRLYRTLPQDKDGKSSEEERKKHIEIRDRVIELNYTFFGYVASHTYIANTAIEYQDKFQSALLHFCECWWWYQWEGHYRTDLSFSVFFKPRISEMIERELSTVKYSTRRTLCMKAADQLGIHWAKLRYEDLADPRLVLSPQDMNSLKAIFGVSYLADLQDHELYIDGSSAMGRLSETEKYMLSDKYNSVVDLLMHEMMDEEKMLTTKDLKQMSDIYDISLEVLAANLPIAQERLYKFLKKNSRDDPFDE